jgi:hypothetical protein
MAASAMELTFASKESAREVSTTGAWHPTKQHLEMHSVVQI